MTVSNGKTPAGLDEAVRTFSGYVRGENGFDELDFKEWLLDWRDKGMSEAEVLSLLNIRGRYEEWEATYAKDFEGNPIATWSGYKWFRNAISDRLEEITDHRDTKSINEWLDRPSQRPAEKEEG